MVFGRGIVGTLKLAATLAFAIPVALMAASFLLEGRQLLGAVFLAIAVLMVTVEEYLATPTDVAGEATKQVVDTVVEEPDEGGESDGRG
jgi:hypothetical protein